VIIAANKKLCYRRQTVRRNVSSASEVTTLWRYTNTFYYYCQLLHNSVGTTCMTNPEQIEIMELEGYIDQRMINVCTQPRRA